MEGLLLVGTLCPFLSTYLIILNVYNGDVLGIDTDLEYLLWYLVPVLISGSYEGYHLVKPSTNPSPLPRVVKGSVYTAWMFGLISNLYWYYWSPFKIPGSSRHRTEYYDTQVFLSQLLYLNLTLLALVKTGYLNRYSVPHDTPDSV